MAQRLHQYKGFVLDAVISSPAKRAYATAKVFADAFQVKKKNFIECPDLYEASGHAFTAAVKSLDDTYGSVALFAHNPGVTAFANSLTNVRVDDMPTCAIFGVRIQTDSWQHFDSAAKEFWFFDYPKNI